VTVEDIWAMFRESDRRFEKMRAEADRRFEETRAEADRRFEKMHEEMRAEIEQVLKETNRVISDLGNRLGYLIEHLLTPKLHEKFKELGYCFKRGTRNRKFTGPDKRVLAEIDVFLESDECALAVEVKTYLMTVDIKDHVKRMAIVRKAADECGDRRKYLGAVAGTVVYPDVIEYALKNGFYVITLSGETVEIEVPDGFKPRIW
jgi:hypothetical protein